MSYISTVHCETHGVDLAPSQQCEDHEDHESSGLSYGVTQAHLAKHPDCTITFTRETVKAHATRVERERQAAHARALEGAEHAKRMTLGSAKRWRQAQDNLEAPKRGVQIRRSTDDRRN